MRKLITLITLVAFVSFSYSCTTPRFYSDREHTDKDNHFNWAKLEKDDAIIAELQKITGEYITFSNLQYGKVKDGLVGGLGRKKDGSIFSVDIPCSEIKWVRISKSSSGKIKKSNTGETCLIISGITVGVAVIILYLITGFDFDMAGN